MQDFCFCQLNMQILWRRRRSRVVDLKLPNVVVKPFNLENFKLSCGRLRQQIVLKCVPHVQHDYISSSHQSDHCFLASWLPLQLSLVKLPTVFLRKPEMTSLSHVPYVCTRWGMVRHRWRLSELSDYWQQRVVWSDHEMIMITGSLFSPPFLV